MQPVRQVEGRAIPFGRKNVDTDLIIPARWLKTISREGLGRGAFEAVRAELARLLRCHTAAAVRFGRAFADRHGLHPTDWGALLAVAKSDRAGAPLTLGELAHAPPREATLVVGPEGGWTPNELDRGAAMCRLVTLGARTLRADAIPIIALAALFALWGEY